MSQEDVFDFIIIGSGGGSVPSAMVMKEAGKRPLILEKQALIGGTSAMSGGMLWIPNNDHLKAAGVNDSHEKARTYMDGLIGDPGPASTPARRDAYIRESGQMIRFLEGKGLRMRHAGFPDYYQEVEGAVPEGRALVPHLFDYRALGDWADKIPRHPMTSLPTVGPEAAKIQTGTIEGKLIALKLGFRMFLNKYLGRQIRGFGGALVGQLMYIAKKAGIPIWTETAVEDFLVENGRVVGVVARRDGKRIEVRAELGVLVNAGGFSHNLEMREKYQPKPTSTKWTQVNPGDTGEMIEAVMKLGAATDLMEEAFWLSCSFFPDGTTAGMHSPNDIGKPHCIVVDSKGKRFVNESVSHMEFGQKMYAAGSVPAWAVFDSNHRNKYPWGFIPPLITPRKFIDSGYLKTGKTLEALATACGIDAEGLKATVARFNEFARKGVDEDFGRGSTAYHHMTGDPRNKPNPSLAPLDSGPFYAVALWPSDVGTCGGIVTDENARALRPDGSVIQGLYVTGNSSATVMGHMYPGGGVSIGPSMTFGYIAARHAARLNA